MSKYDQAIEWLFTQIPNYQKQGGSAYKPGLDNILKLLRSMQNPQEFFRSIHIAGSNGKGSVSHVLAAIYQANGYKVGIFTSPHILDFRERIKINGVPVSEQFVLDFLDAYKTDIQKLDSSFFEITTAMAFEAFKQYEVDVAIVETGLGGRLDATNVLVPELSVITNISLEHTQFLGDTLEKIAYEKAGIIKENRPVVIGEKQLETTLVFEEIAKQRKSTLFYASDVLLKSDLIASYQKKNLATAWKAVEVLNDVFPVDDEISKNSLLNVSELTAFTGRFQLISSNPRIIIDAAHNADGIKNLIGELENLNFEKLIIVYGTSSDKDLSAIFPLLPKNATYFFTEFNSLRSAKIEKLEQEALKFGLKHTCFKKVKLAMSTAKRDADSKDVILIFGSFFLLADVLENQN
ncbi:bifunctional folylpolyglutamate synthase/dihydrofolate synthase [Paracrocinitomix mangrovi]|uniref:bifunctional folylpolyglutamate synthase/dihydrofolate synthase n=1 Tax=Paracrocinitomix mangrovi TaxID=2862509 RepID=UPI001C8F029A|nr:folylpolyglutamate synthase/dihydrofolate synthase family protein [Paracrocinitomix mangrovi]UKN03211.1 bifunctional folylpolyglutamate synthase/dihydrofolate synthase [Paracrocinitomix mangrovi]